MKGGEFVAEPNRRMTDAEVEAEIARLKESPYVKLAKKEERIRYRRRQYLYTLRMYEKKGRELENAGFTMDKLDKLADEAEIVLPEE